MKFHLSRVSNNSKTGPISVTTSSADTCPTCPLKLKGCYADNYPMRFHWDAVTAGTRGLEWPDFLAQIKALPKGQLVRHNQAGDLVGANDKIDAKALKQLVTASKSKRLFGYTHYPVSAHNLKALRHANENNFTINLSADSLTDADRLYSLGLPLVAIVPPGWRGTRSPAGNPVTVCPAQVMDNMSCSLCQLCASSTRKAIVAFEAHGTKRAAVIKLSQLKLDLK